MGLRLDAAHQELIAGVEPELRVAAEALGMGLRDQLTQLAPGLTRATEGDEEPDALLVTLDIDHEGAPDALSLAACVAAHRAYVIARGRPGGVSAGALALARLLVWAQRAALLGRPPTIGWIGPAPRTPEAEGPVALAARAAVRIGDATRRAEAVALLEPPPAADEPEAEADSD
ncbi:MAG: hypothetical protein AB7O78_16480 [Thermoleophilia bacterium]